MAETATVQAGVVSNPDTLNGVNGVYLSSDYAYTYIVTYDPNSYDWGEDRGYRTFQTRINNKTAQVQVREFVFNKPDAAYWSAWK